MGTKIPKVIHYCWFGRGEKPELANKCIDSWKKIMPDYEIKEWNEDNFDISFNKYVEQAYNAKKFAFVSDVARLYIVYNNGGIYLDVDVEVLKSFDELLNYDSFFGFENNDYVNTGVGFGASKKNPIIKDMLDCYKDINFVLDDKTFDLTTCPVRNTSVLKKHGLKKGNKNQILDDNSAIFASEYFCPKDYYTGNISVTDNTYSIHHFNASWHTKKEHKLFMKHQKYLQKYGVELGEEKYNRFISRKKILRVLLLPVRCILHPIKAFKKIKNIISKKMGK